VKALQFNTTSATDLIPLFQPQASGWLGADVSTSIQLNSTTYLWLWGDTLYGNFTNGKRDIIGMPRNSLALITVNNGTPVGGFEFYIRVNKSNYGDIHLGFFSPTNQTEWFWVTTGVMYKGTLYLFAMVVYGAGQWGFHIPGTICLTVDNPLDDPYSWTYNQTKIPQSTYFLQFTSGITVMNDTIYLMGEYNSSYQFLSKIDGASLQNQQWENLLFWSADNTWKSDYTTLQPVIKAPISEGTIVYQPDFEFWYTFYIPFYTTDLYITTAPEITGPWSPFQLIYKIPLILPDTFYYAIKSHPELAGKNEIIATYCSNGNLSDLVDPKIYVPNPIRISISSN